MINLLGKQYHMVIFKKSSMSSFCILLATRNTHIGLKTHINLFNQGIVTHGIRVKKNKDKSSRNLVDVKKYCFQLFDRFLMRKILTFSTLDKACIKIT